MSSEHELTSRSATHILATLRDACATLYPEESSARVVVADAGLDERQIAFSARAVTNWHNILAEAIRSKRFAALLDVIYSAYPTNQTLQAAITAYHQFIATGGHLAVPDQLPVGIDPSDVHGMTNPYLGLRAFHYEDRAIYAGREQLAQETIQSLTIPGAQQTILFITGTSGSGKSSFAQAGLIPLLEQHYATYHKKVRHATFRPSSQPMVMLADALQKLHPGLTLDTLATNTPKDQINLLIIDQFEELFIQSDASQRQPFCDFLTNLPDFAEGRTHVLVTLRVDYLDELFAIQPLWAIAKEGVELRTMKADDLRNAIQKPLQVTYPQKRFASELLDRLVQDAGENPALLPLLQVTLAELWKTGKLVLSNYHSLTNAIRQRAEMVYAFSDHANADPKTPRPAQDQQELLNILLDLINVSADGADHRDARQRRTRQELEQASAQRPPLIEELVNARLLSAATETRNGEDVEVIDIIHESLINNWERLRNAIEEQRQQLQRRARFKLWLGEWLRNGRQDGYLLMDMLLAEARVLVEGQDIEVQRLEAQEFYLCSLEYQTSVQRAKDKAEAEHKARQQWLRRVGVALVIMIIAAGIALWQWQRAQVAASGESRARATSDANAILAIEKRQQAQIAATGEAQARATSDANAILAATREDEAQAAQAETERLSRFIYADQLAQTALVVDRRDRLPQRALLLGIAATQVMSPPVPSSLTTLYDLLGRTGGRTLGMHEAGVNSLAFSPDGKTLASSSSEDGIHLWSLTHPSDSVIILAEHPEDVTTSVTFSPDGKMLASGGFFGVYLWSLVQPTPDPVFLEYEPTGNIVTSVAFSPDGKILASGSTDGTIRLWSLAQPTTATVVLAGHEGSVEQVVFSPDGKTLASGSFDGTIRLWSLAHPDGEPMVLKGHEGSVLSVAFSPDGMTLASGSDDKTIRLWSPHQPNATPVILRGHEDVVLSVAFSPDGKTLASGSMDKTIRLWSIAQAGTNPVVLIGHEDFVTSVAFSPDGKTLASGSDILDRSIRLWSLEQPSANPFILSGHKDGVWSVAFSPDGKRLASSSLDATIRLWSIDQPNTDPLILIGHEDRVTSVAFSPDGKRLASSSWDGTIRLWSLDQPGANPDVLIRHEDGVDTVAFSPDGKTLAGGGLGGIHLWSLDQPSDVPVKLARSKDGDELVAFSPDGRTLAGGGWHGIRLWTLAHLNAAPITFAGSDFWAFAIAFSPDGKMMAGTDMGNTIRLWSLAQPDRVPIIWRVSDIPLLDWAFTIAFSPDGKTLASGSISRTIRLWSLAENSANSTIIGWHDDIVRSVAFSPDGKLVASGSDDQTVRLHVVNDGLIELACRVAGRNLDWYEWQHYFPDETYQRICRTLPIHPSVLQSKNDLLREADMLSARRTSKASLEALNRYWQPDPAAVNRALQLDPDIIVDAEVWNSICWEGALVGVVSQVLDACEKAVAAAPEDGGILDSRGLARALTGDIQGAIADFEFAIQWAKERRYDEEFIASRQRYVDDLREGRNPFTEAELEKLRNE